VEAGAGVEEKRLPQVPVGREEERGLLNPERLPALDPPKGLGAVGPEVTGLVVEVFKVKGLDEAVG
jgi:hypothetical protein